MSCPSRAWTGRRIRAGELEDSVAFQSTRLDGWAIVAAALVPLAPLLSSCWALVAQRRTGSPQVLPETTWRRGLGFLAVSLASLALSVARGETLYLLLRGRVDPLVVNSLGMTAADRTGSAIHIFFTLVLLLLAADAFSRLGRTPEGRRSLLVADQRPGRRNEVGHDWTAPIR